ncbi:ABC transporter substrate-binding protein [Leptolyngbya sp. KIOST-1]|uniref:ABC transporter substrate-binding protein n=1 Tax=Leptolyngbya sp. KIOST-1 TaxID=1229172 RepID=UPI00055A2108|nr:iron-siderophore ABC transporter substrate-binding protein [Leptolyngbya sp. KIOST-1]
MRQLAKLWLLAAVVVIVAIACHSPTPLGEPVPSSPTAAIECRVMLHDGGETELCGQPENVVALSPPLLDILLSLGVQPAGYAEVDLLNSKVFDNPSQQIPYLGDRITTQPVNLGDRHSPSIETLLQLKPDLVLGETFYVKNNYPTLSRIAPTAFFDTGADTGWQPALTAIAQGLNREAQAQQVIAAHNQQVEAVKNQLAPLIAGQSIIVLGWQGIVNQSFVFAGDFTTELLEDLGFQVILGPSDRPGTSMEAVAQIDADHILVMPSGENTIENAQRQWQNDPILQALPAVQAGQLYFMDYQLTRIRGPIAAEIFLNQFAALVTHQQS